ncbi:molybdopterin-dependent oxidoreductase [Hyphomicrobium sp. LHD-15]|uniref:molybdopterin-dependent oxidoreductase n=1 Tax=Hyphomicrobium sp. LHD-15 TaxID=3072142 RepID=UPI00280E03AB|nr:molybdopterin-dependent oxidoreductase [Hyphomicrobium sp. LHD-15]MDQ8699559.1 molybdopterin-dependent oxidoreductase [Hyphomicrobium sp. LHD-15]
MNAPLQAKAVKTTCPYCGVGCGVLARPDGFGGAQVQGDPEHPANFGRLCSKGSALGETLSLDGRLLHPMMRGPAGVMARAPWDDALNAVAKGFRETIARHGPDSVAFYVSGQLLTEDYYVANKLMKGFIGSANIDTNSRLCMASSVAGHRRAFGADTVPGCYEDLDEADLLILTGSNAAWCHPILFQRMLKNKRERGARIVVIDPRATPTSDEADLLLQIAPGMDSVLFSGLLAYLADQGVLDRDYIRDHTNGFSEALARARHIAPDAEAVAEQCNVPRERIETFFAWVAATRKTVTLYSQGVNQSAQGTDKVNAIINCHLATGRIGQPGMGPFSLTGQPNAMGGREVGGLANQLAAHMDFEPGNVDRVRRFWDAPAVAPRPGLKAVDLFDAVAQGRIKALWIMATNPVVSLPRADAVRTALGNLELLVVSDVVAATDTIRAGAHILLPAAGWGEKDGTVTNSERRISRQRGFLTTPGEAQPDWWIVSEVAKRMGFANAFNYASAAEIFEEHCALSAFENGGTRDFDIAGLGTLSHEDYAALDPVQWPVAKNETNGAKRLFAAGGFYTPDRRARFVAVAKPKLAAEPGRYLPLLLNTGRIRDQWHTMTRTGKSPRLGAHIEEPRIAVHPDDAQSFNIEDGAFARVSTLHGSAVLRVAVTPSQRRGEIFAPIHWNGETASDARVGALVHAACDPISGQPEMKATEATIAPVQFAMHGFFLTRKPVDLPTGVWWARSTVEGGFGYRIAVPSSNTKHWADIARDLLGNDEIYAELLDEGQGRYRAAIIRGETLDACVFLAKSPQALPGWEWLKQQLAAPSLTEPARRALLAGRAAEAGTDSGPVVCACFGVGRNAICRTISDRRATSPEAVGRELKAGTNCGSCIPEIRRLIAETEAQPQPQAV